MSTGQGSLDQGGEQEHMKQVCAFSSAAHVMRADASVDIWQEQLGYILLWAHSRCTKVLAALVPLLPTAHAECEEASDKWQVHK